MPGEKGKKKGDGAAVVSKMVHRDERLKQELKRGAENGDVGQAAIGAISQNVVTYL